MTSHVRATRRELLPAAFGLAISLVVAACGSSTATPSPAPATVPAATAGPSASPSPGPPRASLLPVPTTVLGTIGPAPAGLTDATAATLTATLDSVRTSNRLPGISAAVVFPDGSVWSGQSGQAVISDGTAVGADTLFSVGSITKTFVAALATRLVARGTIGLDDPVSKYVPYVPNGDNISIRQLLNHTSGIRDLFDSFSAQILADPAATWTAQQVMAGLGNPYFAPGRGYHYSNTNYLVLGAAIEAATGKSMPALLRSEFLDPLGLGHTFYQVGETPSYPEAHGYMKPAASPRDNSAGAMIPFTAEITAVGAAGALVSNASDLARWASALYGGRVVDLASLASIVDVSPSLAFRAAPSFPYGFGFEETTVAGQTAWGHRGHLDGFWSAMWYLPDSRFAVVVLTNADWADPVSAASVLITAARGAAATPSPAAS